jgi:glutathione S-transferase
MMGLRLHRDHRRTVFNYKGIPYRTEWVEVPDIEPLSKKLGINPTGQKKDGSPFYTLPAIYDPATGTAIADSFAIAEYLENTYPETPSVFPKDTAALQKAFEPTIVQNICAAWPFIIPAVALKLNPRSEEYLRLRALSFGESVTVPTGDTRTEEWGKFKKGLDIAHSYFDKKGPYMMGDTISWSDIVLFGFLSFFKVIWGEDSEEWKDIASWNDGRWEAHVDALKKYNTVV